MTDPTLDQDTPDGRPDQGLADNIETGGAKDPQGQDLKDGVDGEDRSFHTSTVEANRSVEQGNGIGQRELDAQSDPNEEANGGSTQAELDAQADTSRDNHQTPRGNDAVRDTADNLGGG